MLLVFFVVVVVVVVVKAKSKVTRWYPCAVTHWES